MAYGRVWNEVHGVNTVVLKNEGKAAILVKASVDRNVLEWTIEPRGCRWIDFEVQRDSDLALSISKSDGTTTTATIGYFTPGLGVTYHVYIGEDYIREKQSSWI